MLASEQFIDSEDETLEELFEGEGDADADADADADDEPLQGDEVTEDGEGSVCAMFFFRVLMYSV
jgi:hypothetical protein